MIIHNSLMKSENRILCFFIIVNWELVYTNIRKYKSYKEQYFFIILTSFIFNSTLKDIMSFLYLKYGDKYYKTHILSSTEIDYHINALNLILLDNFEETKLREKRK